MQSIAEAYGWTPQDIGELTVSQLHGILTTGVKKDIGHSEAHRRAAEAKELRLRWMEDTRKRLERWQLK